MTLIAPFRPASDVVTWRPLGPRLWVGRRGDEHLGVVERGRRYSATDAEGRLVAEARTLDAAQSALERHALAGAPTGTAAVAEADARWRARWRLAVGLLALDAGLVALLAGTLLGG